MFDTLHHGRIAALSVSEGHGDFDIFGDGLPFTFADAWEPYRINHISLFLDIPITCVVSILIIMFLFHMFGSTLIIKLLGSNQALRELIPQAFYTLITPPLHIDWELFYRIGDGKQSITQCWKRSETITFIQKATCTSNLFRSKVVLLIHIMLITIEHLIFCIPLISLKISIIKVSYVHILCM